MGLVDLEFTNVSEFRKYISWTNKSRLLSMESSGSLKVHNRGTSGKVVAGTLTSL